ncbi:MAG: hypothetical protein LBU11_01430 [Zoogloeaceae bacterium]|jgi:hypothetical protein|nr:hypothetical protein [Zoogloeaceae bacterium]
MTISPSTLDAARLSDSGSVDAINANNSGGSILQLQFAALQMALAEASRSDATGYINDIQKAREEQRQLTAMLQQARQLQADAESSGGCATMPADMKQYMDANALAYDKTGNDDLHNKDEWEVAIASLQGRMESLGSNTQQLMVFMQGYMGQYNSYLQGANSAIQQSDQTLAELLKAR